MKPLIKSVVFLFLLSTYACSKDKPSQETAHHEHSMKAESSHSKEKEAKPDTVSQYTDLLASLQKTIQNKATPTQIEKDAKKLTTLGEMLVRQYLKKYKECDPYLTALVSAKPALSDLSLEEIEVGYHAGDKLPKMKSEKCYHVKDLLVHPATVVIMARNQLKGDNAYDKALAELIELDGHLGQVKEDL